jgi:carbamoyltransferase
MLILGVNGGDKAEQDHDTEPLSYHDAAAVLLRDGVIVAAVEEERLDRIKHTNCFPARAIQYCLDIAGVDLRALDAIAVASARLELERRSALTLIRNPREPGPVGAAAAIGQRFERHFGVDVRQQLQFVHHHHAHCWSAYALSGFDEALVLSLDGLGDDSAGMLFDGRDRSLRLRRTYSIADSLGWLYRTVISFIGFGDFDEYKAMGLAPYGDRERYKPLLQACYALAPDGRYSLQSIEKWLSAFRAAGMEQHLRRRDDAFTQVHMDLAAALQAALEEIVLHVLAHEAKTSGHRHLCLAGGVAHNCTLNGKILQSGLFERVFVQPAAHDAGTALGAALAVAFEREPAACVRTLPHVFTGPGLGEPREIREALGRWRELVTFDRPDDLASGVATLLADGAVIGWVQGQSEFGPRALGHRSILADPRPAANKARINAMIKKREGFRPFAPAVAEERAREFFEIPACDADLSFMTYALSVRPEWRETLGAVTHVDGSARIQVVRQSTNATFWALLQAFGAKTGVPILLNTSFNNNAEPIVQSIDDAIACFLTAGLDCLVVGDYVVTRREGTGAPLGIAKLAPAIVPWACLEARRTRNGSHGIAPAFAIARIKGYLPGRETAISAALHGLLCDADGQLTLEELVEARTHGPEAASMLASMTSELLPLWSKRVITLTPPSPAVHTSSMRETGAALQATAS